MKNRINSLLAISFLIGASLSPATVSYAGDSSSKDGAKAEPSENFKKLEALVSQYNELKELWEQIIKLNEFNKPKSEEFINDILNMLKELPRNDQGRIKSYAFGRVTAGFLKSQIITAISSATQAARRSSVTTVGVAANTSSPSSVVPARQNSVTTATVTDSKVPSPTAATRRSSVATAAIPANTSPPSPNVLSQSAASPLKNDSLSKEEEGIEIGEEGKELNEPRRRNTASTNSVPAVMPTESSSSRGPSGVLPVSEQPKYEGKIELTKTLQQYFDIYDEKIVPWISQQPKELQTVLEQIKDPYMHYRLTTALYEGYNRDIEDLKFIIQFLNDNKDKRFYRNLLNAICDGKIEAKHIKFVSQTFTTTFEKETVLNMMEVIDSTVWPLIMFGQKKLDHHDLLFLAGRSPDEQRRFLSGFDSTIFTELKSHIDNQDGK